MENSESIPGHDELNFLARGGQVADSDPLLTERKLATLRQLAEETTAALDRFSQAAIEREGRVLELEKEVAALRRRPSAEPGTAEPPETAEQRRAAQELMEDAVRAREVAERLNRVLRDEIAERMRVEDELRENRVRLARELEDTKILQRTGSLLIQDERGGGLHESILEAAMAIMGADFSSIQVADPEGAELQLLAWKNFHPDSAEYWRTVPVGTATSCGMALRDGERIVVPDVDADEALQGSESLRHYRLSGIRATQSTPLIARDGRLIGMMSTHWRQRHEPDERALALFDVLARQMADVLERRQARDAMRSSEVWLAGQNEAFQSVLNGATLEESLAVLVRTAVAHMKGENTRCAFYMADHAGEGLYPIAGMDDAYPEAVDGGRWSFPIETSSGKMVGTAAFYFETPREATARDYEFAAVLTRAAAIIISRSQEADERARAENARRQSEQRYRTLFDSIDEGLGIAEILRDASGKAVDVSFVDVNGVFERLTGLVQVQGRLLGESGFGLEASWLEVLGEVARTGVPKRVEHHHRQLGRWFRVHISRVGGDGGNQVGIVLEDISEQKFRERNQALLTEITDELVEMESVAEMMERLGEKITRHFDASWCLFAELGEDLQSTETIYIWNTPEVPSLDAAYCGREFRSERVVAENRRGEPSVVSDTRSDPRVSAENYDALGIRSFVIFPLVRDRVCRFYLAVIDRKVRAWRPDEVELARELTHRIWIRLERARAQEALRHSEERLRTLADSVPQLIWTNSGEGTADYFNRRWYEYTGLTYEQSYGLGWEACVHPDDAAAAKQEWAWTQAAGEIFDCEYRLRGSAGQYRWFIGRNVPMKGADGRVAGWFGSATDIHDLKQAQAELQEADLRKNHFLAMLGHELRNPLAAIRNGVKLLRSEKSRPESRVAALPIVADQVSHMERLVDDLLDLTRVVQGSVQVEREPIAVQDALRQALEMVRHQAEAGGFVFDVKVPDEPLEILGDRVRLTQVFMNVLGNAVKYSDDSRRIEVWAAREGSDAVVRVRDYGRGISPELLPRIFEPFVQATPGLTLQGGLGLGLAVVRQLVWLHDGDVEIFSKGERQGCELVLRLPLSHPPSL